MKINIYDNKPVVEMPLDEYKDLMVTVNKLEEELYQIKYVKYDDMLTARQIIDKLNEDNKKLTEDLHKCKSLYIELDKENVSLKNRLTDAQDDICLLEDENEKLKKEKDRLRKLVNCYMNLYYTNAKDNQILQDKLAAIEDIIKGES